jgi:hypothetical protein
MLSEEATDTGLGPARSGSSEALARGPVAATKPWGRPGWLLLLAGVLVYLITRFWGITRFPIYFFCDEANPTLIAEDVFARGLRDGHGTRFPLYFELASNRWCPELQVYFHGAAAKLFGKSVLTVRSTQVVVSLLAPIAVALILRLVFGARSWWAGVFLMALVPAWFLHSRTGFDPVVMATFYASFLLSYLLYRKRSPRYIFAAALFGAATFYSYSNGQMVMAAVGAFLLVSDFRYHLRNWRVVVPGLILMAFLAIPAARFRIDSPGSLTLQLKVVGSYWYSNDPLDAKLLQFGRTYARGLSPLYWFLPNDELIRHQMKGYGHINTWLLPAFLIGLGVTVWRTLRGSVEHRTLLLATLATPAGAALADIGLSRVFAFIIPAAILIALGIEVVFAWLVRRFSETALSFVLALGLAVPSFTMLRDALVNGPTWFTDYTLYGMQYGSRQVFGELVPALLTDFPHLSVGVSPNWANLTEIFVPFFVPAELQSRVRMQWIGDFLSKRQSGTKTTILVMPADEFEKARESPKFKEVKVERVIPYPDGRPGFFAVRLQYADDVDRIMAEELEARTRPVTEEVVVGGQTYTVTHSQFDGGTLQTLFDQDPASLVRGLEANPLVLDFAFKAPRPVRGLSVTTGSMNMTLTVEMTREGEVEPAVFTQTFRDLATDPTVEMRFGEGPPVTRLKLSILQLGVAGPTNIHVRGVRFR